IDAEVVRRIDERGRSPEGRRPGDLAFVGTFARVIFERRGRFDPVLEVVGHGRAALVLVSNVQPYSFLRALAIQAAPEAVFEEGLDFLAPRSLTPRTLPPLLFSLATGRPARNAFRGHDLDRIEVRCDARLPLQAGAVHALADEDWIFPSYRESAIGLVRGMPPATVLSWWRGHPAGWWNPADYNVASICVPIGTQVPHAAGLAWGKRLRGEGAC